MQLLYTTKQMAKERVTTYLPEKFNDLLLGLAAMTGENQSQLAARLLIKGIEQECSDFFKSVNAVSYGIKSGLIADQELIQRLQQPPEIDADE